MKRIVSILFFISVLTGGFHSVSAEPPAFQGENIYLASNETKKNLSADDWNEKGIKLADSGKDKEAIKAYTNAIKLSPKEPALYSNRAISYARLEQYQEAIKDYDRVLEFNPKNDEAYHNRGGAKGELKNYKGAIKDFDRAIALNPKAGMTYYSRGMMYNKLSNPMKALDDWKTAARLGYKEAQNYLTEQGVGWERKKAKAKTEKKKKVAAKTVKKTQKKIKPKKKPEIKKAAKAKIKTAEKPKPSSEVKEWIEKGNQLYKEKKYGEALVAYTKAIELDPENPEAYLNRGLVFFKIKEFRKAVDNYTKAIEPNPDFKDAYFRRGQAYCYIEEYQKAVEDCTKAIKLNPDKEVLSYIIRAYAYKKLGKKEKSKKDIEKVSSIHSFAPNLFKQVESEIDETQKKLRKEAAETVFFNKLKSAHWYNKGRFYSLFGMRKKALNAYTRSIENDPQFAKAYFKRGAVHEKFGNQKEAAEDYKKASKLGLEDAEIHLKDSGIEEQSKKDKEAVYINMNDGDPKYRGYLKSVYAKIKENWDYPEAIKEGFSGKVSIEFNIEKDGSVSDTKIVSSSGNTVFDKIAVASIKKASPFPEVPDELLENSKIGEYKRLIIKGNFNYNK